MTRFSLPDRTVLLICSKVTNSDGVGRLAISLRTCFIDAGYRVELLTAKEKSIVGNIQTICRKYWMSHLFDIIFMIVSEMLRVTLYRSHITVSPSVICAFGTDQIHFSSCHLHSLLVANERWKLFISPRNLTYVLIEYYQYKFCKHAIFISHQEKYQFEMYYGERLRVASVIHPVLSNVAFKEGHVDQLFGSNFFERKVNRCLFIGYNFRIKGLRIAQMALRNTDFTLDVIGQDKKYKNNCESSNVSFLGSLSFDEIDWSSYGFFIFPSHSDAYGFVIQEAVRNGLIPICSSQAGASEVLYSSGLIECVIRQNVPIMSVEFPEIANSYEWNKLSQRPENYDVFTSDIYSTADYNTLVLQALNLKKRGS